jgi:hypothetical protein
MVRGVRWQRAAYLPLATLAVFGVAVAVLLARSPLNEMPDTYCETVLQSPVGGCAAVAARRWRWIAWVLGFAVVLAAAAVVVGRRWRPRGWGRGPMIALRVAALVWMLVAVSLGIAAGSYLTIGVNGGMCGSTLSRVDERGEYNRDHPMLCAPSYAASRAHAWKLGLVGLAAFAAGTVTEAIDRRAAIYRPRSRRAAPS